MAILLTGAFLGPLDFFIVNLALPSIQKGLGASSADTQLVISGYAVIYASFLITGGRLGDIYGRKSVFLLGLGGFALASGFCGLATSTDMLILGRTLQALSAAAMAPQALASIHALFPPHERVQALMIYGATLGLASVVGQLAGGVLVALDLGGLGWRVIFLINLPVALVAAATAIPFLRETRKGPSPTLDIVGVVLSSLALLAFVIPLTEGRDRGWPLWSIAMLAATPFLVEMFRRYEIRLALKGGEPLVPLAIFASPGLLRALGAVALIYALATFFLTVAIYCQVGLAQTTMQAGLMILPFCLGNFIGPFVTGLVARQAGGHGPSIGYGLMAVSTAAMAATVLSAAPAAPPAIPFVMSLFGLGLGMGITIPTMMRVVVERIDPAFAGLVGGVFNSTLQVSAACSVALIGGFFFTAWGPAMRPEDVGHAFGLTMLLIAGVYVVAGMLAGGLGQRRLCGVSS
ncbi:MFS transporter [Arboricoccus pini]|uniref:MFS transporter n=1 Tax=Arboricoccus pini TaxID=1963835 RepID=UPI0013FE1ABD|nr:MFS transporter [Arboricoccus pini]